MANARHGYKPQFTKPSWIVNWTYERGGKSSAVVPYSGGSELQEPICIIPHDDITEDGEKEMLANAALIVAAPGLYYALARCVERMEAADMVPDESIYAALEQAQPAPSAGSPGGQHE